MDIADMTVLFVSSIGDMRGGAERSLLELARALASRGYEVALASWHEGPLVEAFRELGPCCTLGTGDPASPLGGATRSRALRPLRPAIRILAWLRLWVRPTGGEARWLGNVIESTGADLVHTNCDMSPVPAAKATRVAGVPWVAHVRDSWRSWFHPRTARALRRAHAVVAPSLFLADQFSRRGIECRVVPNPVAGGMYRSAAYRLDVGELGGAGEPGGSDGSGRGAAERRAEVRARLGIRDSAFAVAVIGRIDAQKGTMDIVTAADHLVGSTSDREEAGGGPDRPVHFVVAGSGTDPEETALVQAIERAGVGDRVHVVGYRTDVSDWLPALDAVSVPSRGEPFGRMIVEGMHAGLPVVAYRDGAAPELIEHEVTGLLVSPRDPEALASALRSLADDPDRARRMGVAGRDAAGRFEPAVVAEAVEALYTGLEEG